MTKAGLPLSWRTLIIAGAAVACTSAVSPALSFGSSPGAAAQQPERIDWSIERSDGGKVQLTIESRWDTNNNSMWSNDRPISDLAGLSGTQLAGPMEPVRFALIREAGRLDCSGTAGSGRGSGRCGFTPDPGFGTYLQARAIGAPTPHQAFSLTMSGVGRGLVDALDKNGFERPNIDELTAMGIHGATADYVRALSGLGYRLSANDVVAFKIHGVEPDYIRALAPITPKLRHIGPADLVSLRIHGVEPGFVRALAAMGPEFQNVTADDLVSMSIHSVKPELASAFVRLEGGQLRSDDLVSMAIHGVTADYIERLASAGYRNFTAEELVSMAIHGVTADDATQLAAMGYRSLSAADLVTMAIHGVTPGYVRSLQRSGMARLPADQLVRLRLSGFEPDTK